MIPLLLMDPSPTGGGSGAWGWIIIALLGAWHGLNPGMGWLFAAALGLQEGRKGAAWRALPPLALGHALAVGVALGAALLLGVAASPRTVRWIVGVALVGYGVFRLLRRGHPRFGGMRVGVRDLTLWSFLMASAHGAGLMVLPLVTGGGGGEATEPPLGHAGHFGGGHPGTSVGTSMASSGMEEGVMSASLLSPETGEMVAAVLVHTGSYLLVTGLLAVLVVHWWGLRLLRSLWIDLDRIWAGALILTGVVTLVL
jgi:hypothetical protein